MPNFIADTVTCMYQRDGNKPPAPSSLYLRDLEAGYGGYGLHERYGSS